MVVEEVEQQRRRSARSAAPRTRASVLQSCARSERIVEAASSGGDDDADASARRRRSASLESSAFGMVLVDESDTKARRGAMTLFTHALTGGLAKGWVAMTCMSDACFVASGLWVRIFGDGYAFIASMAQRIRRPTTDREIGSSNLPGGIHFLF